MNKGKLERFDRGFQRLVYKIYKRKINNESEGNDQYDRVKKRGGCKRVHRKCYRHYHAYDYSHLFCLFSSALILVAYVKVIVYIDYARCRIT
jgi:hypothetical protein